MQTLIELQNKIDELEGQVAMLREVLSGVRVFVTSREKIKHPEGTEWFDEALSATAQTSEEYRRRVQAEALEEAAKTLGQERNYGVDPYSKLLSMASELRNPSAQAEGKGEK